VKKLQTFSEIEDVGVRHFEFLQISISDVIDVFQIEVPMFPLMLVTMSQIVKKWQTFFEIQDGNVRHLKLWLPRLFDVTDVIFK